MSVSIRGAGPADAAPIAAIYNQGIGERVATFETRPHEGADFLPALADAEGPPFLVAADGDRVLGWARLSAYGDRACYAGVGEATLYVERSARGGGVGRLLLDALCGEAAGAGYWKVLGLLFTGNDASRALFRAGGFREVGTFHRHGRLDGEWRDVVVVERLVGEGRS